MIYDLIRRLGKLVADVMLVPLVNYCFNPIVTKFFLLSGLSPPDRLRATQPSLRMEIDELRKEVENKTPKNPCAHGFKVYSQTDEDGIIEYVLSKIPQHTKTYIEIGCGRGIENNTHYLALKDYRGCWIDGSEENINFIRTALGALEFSNLLIQKHFVTIDNIGTIIGGCCNFIGTSEPDFFSLDIDGNDFHVMKEALKHFRPRTICAEYNPKFPPPVALMMHYNPKHTWFKDDYYGASLQAFCDLLNDYKLVTCNLSGVNAFFVRRDLSTAFADFTPLQLYQPFREHLISVQSGFSPTLNWLKDKLTLLSPVQGAEAQRRG